MSQKPDFSSARRTLGWAEKDIADLKSSVDAFFKTEPCTLVPYKNDSGMTHVVAEFREIPPDDIDRHAVHAARNLRAALDQAAWVTAVASRKSGNGGTHFPFPHSSDESNIRDVRRKGCAKIPDEIFSYFLSFKPYPGGDDLLACLNTIRNIPDHRVIIPMGISVSGGHSIGGGHVELFLAGSMQWNARAKNIVLCSFQGDFHYQGMFTFNVTLSDVPFRAPAADLLLELRNKVASIIDGTEAECHRIGLL